MSKLTKEVNISRIPPLIPLRLSKKVLEKFKFYKGKDKASESQSKVPKEYSYAQASKSTINDIVKIKDNFSNLSAKKIEEIHNILTKPKKTIHNLI